MTVHVVTANDGAVGIGDTMQTALAQCLLNMHNKPDTLAFTVMDAEPGEVVRDDETGGVLVTREDVHSESTLLKLTDGQVAQIEAIHDTLQMVELYRDNLFLQLVGAIKDVEPERYADREGTREVGSAGSASDPVKH